MGPSSWVLWGVAPMESLERGLIWPTPGDPKPFAAGAEDGWFRSEKTNGFGGEEGVKHRNTVLIVISCNFKFQNSVLEGS